MHHVVLLLVLFIVCGCGSQGLFSDRETVIIGYIGEPERFDPTTVSEGTAADLMPLMFNSLVKADSSLSPIPDLAESWEESPDGRVWTFHLRRGVKFHDGADLTAEDVLFTYKRIIDPGVGSPHAPFFETVKRLEALDPLTLRITLTQPQSSFPLYMRSRWIVSKRSFDERGETPVGTGPFRLHRWERGKEFEFVAHRDYFEGPPRVRRILARPYPDYVAMWAALIRGEIDLTNDLPPRHFMVVKKQPDLSTFVTPGSFYYMLLFNMTDPLFQDRRVREAFSYAIDRERIIDFALSGYGRLDAGPFFPDSWAASPDVRPVPYDPERSLALLHEAGYRDDNHDRFLEKGGRDLSVQLIVIGDDEIKPRATIALQRVFYEIGVKMKVVVIPPDTILAHDFYRGTFQMIFMQANVGIDPAIAATVWHSRGRYNFGMYHNAEVDSFFNQGRQTLDNRERAFIYQHIHALIARDHPACFLFFRESLVGLSSRLQGARGYPENILSSAGRWKVGRPSRRNGRLL